LFSLIGTTYGGDGQTTFGLPKVAPPTNAPDPRHLISTQGIFPSTGD
jgi:microcystin-dependent protein